MRRSLSVHLTIPVVIVVMLALSVTACGKRGDPRPPVDDTAVGQGQPKAERRGQE